MAITSWARLLTVCHSYSQDSGTSTLTLESPAQPSPLINLYPPGPPSVFSTTPAYSPGGAGAFYSPATHLFSNLDVRPRLGSKYVITHPSKLVASRDTERASSTHSSARVAPPQRVWHMPTGPQHCPIQERRSALEISTPQQHLPSGERRSTRPALPVIPGIFDAILCRRRRALTSALRFLSGWILHMLRRVSIMFLLFSPSRISVHFHSMVRRSRSKSTAPLIKTSS